ncbi:hypothetical protein [Polymorphobacter sp.]|uniref:hypothetical protein n=1 Tax=Polymorphobacter sp. TaxID=1909290 RepID=UPI003F724BD7
MSLVRLLALSSSLLALSGWALNSTGPAPDPDPPGVNSIISAEIEPNGWVLSVTLAGVGSGTFSDYALAPDNPLPRVLLYSTHGGFSQSGGEAVSGSRFREIPATAPLRLPVNPASPNTPVIDEVDLGGGQRRVRIALANVIYATDTAVTLDVLSDWRNGEGSEGDIAVTNNSTVVAPIPIFRWSDLQFRNVQGQFRLSVVVASHHPLNFQPAAGVKFTATDGTTVKTYWTTALRTDTSYGDNLRCYYVDVDPATATALTAGLLRCDVEVYPWLGNMRSTDPAGTKSFTDLRTVGRNSSAETPMVIGYDPTGERYNNQFVYVDAANGTDTASAAMVATTLAGAKAVAPAARAASILVAQTALYLANKTLPAANGGSSATRAMDGARIVLAPGVTTYASATVPNAALQTWEMPYIIEGDPDDADPATNCILRSGSLTVVARGFRCMWRNVAIELGQATLQGAAGVMSLLNCVVRGKAGFETSTSSISSAAHTGGTWSMQVINTRWTNCGISMSAATQLRPILVRHCEFSRLTRSAVMLTSRFVEHEDATVTGQSVTGQNDVTSDVAIREDCIYAYNDFRHCRARVFQFSFPSAAQAGTTFASFRRVVIMANLVEVIAGSNPILAIGEGGATSMHYNIFDNNTLTGERGNFWYNDPATCSDTAQNGDALCNRQVNNAYDRNATKHDLFLESGCSANGFNGYRPWLLGSWSAYCGVMHEANWDGGRAASDIGAFRYWFRGLRSVQTTVVTDPLYTDDRSKYGTAAGGGDYRPTASSPLLGRMRDGNTDRDLLGNVRGVGSPCGALEAAA